MNDNDYDTDIYTEPFDVADSTNIPVDLFLTQEDDGTWSLAASNYKVRRGKVEQPGFKSTAASREELVEIIEKYVIPLYENALKQLRAICDGKNHILYHWKE